MGDNNDPINCIQRDVKEILQRVSVLETKLTTHLDVEAKKLENHESSLKQIKFALIGTATALGIWILTRLVT